jgi:tRNA modification GTPase
MNQLARREVAIVSPHAGTTRDIIEVHLDLNGYPVTAIDTAGIRNTDDPVEQEGVRRARARAADADLVLWLTDGSGPADIRDTTAPVWSVHNKIDLAGVGDAARGSGATAAAFRISAKRGDGLGDLVAAIVGFAEAYFGANDTALIGRERQRKLLQETALALRRALVVIGDGEELAAEELRAASTSLGRLLGRVDVEDILDVIFREFCIGK